MTTPLITGPVFEKRLRRYLKEGAQGFLVADDLGATLGSLIKLSVALELYIKKALQDVEPLLIVANVDWKKWEGIGKEVAKLLTADDKRKYIVAELSKIGPKANDRTITFGVAIALLPCFYDLPAGTTADLEELLNYRNGLFHWKAPEEAGFEISKRSFRLIEWIFAFIEGCRSWRDGGDLVHIDPFGDIRNDLAFLKKWIDSEVAFNFQRRVFKHRHNHGIYLNAKLRSLDAEVDRNARPFRHVCPVVCGCEVMELVESGKQEDGKWIDRIVFAHCTNCDLKISEAEYQSVWPGCRRLADQFDSAGSPA